MAREVVVAALLWWAVLTHWQSGEPSRYLVAAAALFLTWALSEQRRSRGK